MHKINHANIKEWAKNYDGPLFDGILCDPPYHLVSMTKRWGSDKAHNTPIMDTKEGGVFARSAKGFMGKDWDGVDENGIGIAQDPEMWRLLYNLLKPGAHLLAFSGSRTYHRMAVAIEDAGFEIRDMIEWVYGSGFPKSLNIGKAVDKIQGNEREVKEVIFPDGSKPRKTAGNFTVGEFSPRDTKYTKGTSEWEGYGTALKPAHESVCVAQKPLETSTETEYIISICQKLFAQIATNRSMLNPQEQKEVSSIVQWLAENNINTLEDLSEAMAILQSCIKGVTSLNIVWSWLITLAESWQAMNTSTISTRLNMTTELKILDSLEWASILRSIMLPKSNKTDGLSASAYNADSLLNAVRLKLQDTLTHFAEESVISKAGNQGLLPRSEPCVLARKPIEGSVANNVLKHGTGGLNIDKCRIPASDDRSARYNGKPSLGDNGTIQFGRKTEVWQAPDGRFPANLCHDGSDEVEAVFPQTKSGGGVKLTGKGSNNNVKFQNNTIVGDSWKASSGSASRFFYCAKSSKSERNAGLDTPNTHPTLKPLSLTKYLATLIKPPTGGRLLVPFSGSGSEMIGALQAGWEYVEGVELTEEYIPIAEARIKYWTSKVEEESKQLELIDAKA